MPPEEIKSCAILCTYSQYIFKLLKGQGITNILMEVKDKRLYDLLSTASEDEVVEILKRIENYPVS